MNDATPAQPDEICAPNSRKWLATTATSTIAQFAKAIWLEAS
jgi:hypothetical protein